MSPTGVHSLERTIHTTNRWLADLGNSIGTEDREFVYHVLRRWLHSVRDGLTVEGAAHLAAQLPDLLRGIYYNGWNPSAVPIRRDRQEFIEHFAQSGRIARTDVPKLAPIVTAALRDEMSPAPVEHALSQLPQDIRELLQPPESS
ncbi:hypothetical protein Aph01nite_77360 [Acrocarpospora phusangensis]|uniref:DUF2267 domain-containing protein n=1 Tax=Acrocarpospora phusangensis TaxID=1070424 RepID=A0A919QIF3_9ACTN|nr:DUF2267 domain-containing protein [Acrocarpospora phusangensis]GIH29426.1 hypothetical protein Aph01nite_77360 [Acrocarpospora phusangensis]